MDETTPAPSLARSGGLVAPALMLVNVAAYVLSVGAAHVLSEDGYGTLGSLMGVLLVASVPSIAAQAVVAGAVARGGADVTGLLRRAGAVGLASAAVTAALSPLLASFLHTGVAGPLWVAAGLLPFGLLSGALGALQGAERFGAMAVLLIAQAVARAAGLVPLALSGASASTVLAALAAGNLAAAVLGALMTLPARPGATQLPGLGALVHAGGGLLAVLALSNLDVLLARHELGGTASGRYAVGSVLAKAAFWLPQAVAVVVFPRLADVDAGRQLLRSALKLVGALGLVEVVGCVLLAGVVVPLAFGDDYRSLSSYAWLWVVQGAALALLQLLVYRAIAVHDRRPAVVLAVAGVVETAVVLVAGPDRPVEVVAVAAVTAVLAVAALLRPALRS